MPYAPQQPTPGSVKAAYLELSPAPANVAAATAALNAQTIAYTADTTFPLVYGILYARNSWVRVQQVASGKITPQTLPNGYTAAEIQSICEMLVDGASPPGLSVQMSNAAISTQVQANLDALSATKLTDGFGIIWAAGEYGASAPGSPTQDPGDKAVLLAELVNLSGPAWSETITIGMIQTATAQ